MPAPLADAMILAAGRGKRMMPLTKDTPKPLLEVHGLPLIVHHLKALKKAGIKHVVINLAWCGDKIPALLGDGSDFGMQIQYSQEPEGGLETAGGILQALPLLADEFIVVNGDVFTDYDFHSLTQLKISEGQAHLVLVENPPHNPEGDFGFHNGLLHSDKVQGQAYTFAGIGKYQQQFFKNLAPGFVPLAPHLREKMHSQDVFGELYLGAWHDIGTPERLREINQEWQRVR